MLPRYRRPAGKSEANPLYPAYQLTSKQTNNHSWYVCMNVCNLLVNAGNGVSRQRLLAIVN
jgi:hypothetical protein